MFARNPEFKKIKEHFLESIYSNNTHNQSRAQNCIKILLLSSSTIMIFLKKKKKIFNIEIQIQYHIKCYFLLLKSTKNFFNLICPYIAKIFSSKSKNYILT